MSNTNQGALRCLAAFFPSGNTGGGAARLVRDLSREAIEFVKKHEPVTIPPMLHKKLVGSGKMTNRAVHGAFYREGGSPA